MGWLGFARVDGLTAPLVLVALAYGVGRPFIASVLLAIGTWVKVWPAAVMLALFAVVKNRLRGGPGRACDVGGRRSRWPPRSAASPSC